MQDLTVYTDGSGWDFTVKQGAITISVKSVQPKRSQPPARQWRWKQSPKAPVGLLFLEVTVQCSLLVSTSS